MRLVRSLSLLVAMAFVFQSAAVNAQGLKITGFGEGTYVPNATLTGGPYSGVGVSTVLGWSPFQGAVEITGADPNNPNILYWQNPGQGTADETFHVNRSFFGRLKSRVTGQVQLIPMDASGTNFTAVWEGRFEFVGGTGLFRHAQGFSDVVAVNLPFQLTDPEWNFLWSWEGRLSLRRR